MTDLQRRLEEVFRGVFNRPDLELRPELTADDVAGWDSMKHIELIVSVEDAFGVKFKTAEVGRLGNVGELLTALERKLDTGGRG